MRQDLIKSVLGDKSNLLAQIDEKSVEESRHNKQNQKRFQFMNQFFGLLNSHRANDPSKLLSNKGDKTKGQPNLPEKGH